MQWITQDSVESVSLLKDFLFEFVKVYRGFMIYMRAREETCSYTKIKFEKMSASGQYNYEGAFKGNEFKLSSWIVETDYNNYAVQFSCGEITDGVCTSNDLIVWSRRQTLALEYMEKVNSVIQNLCLNPAAAYTIQQTNVCPPWQDEDCESSDGMSLTKAESFTLMLCCLVLNVFK